MLSETCFDIDFNLVDVLTSIDSCASVANGEKADSYGNSKSFSFSFSVDNKSSYVLPTDVENNAIDDDLSALLDSCHVHSRQTPGLISLATLASNHLSKKSALPGSKQEKCLSGQFISDTKNEVSDGINLMDCLDDILFEEESVDQNKISCTENILGVFNWKHSFVEDTEKNGLGHKIEANKISVEDDVIPDINLSCCIKKKNNNDAFSPVSSSPESTDSGYYEIDSSSEKCISSSSDETSSWENTFGITLEKPTLVSSKQSLLSRAVSARPKTDKSRRKKLQNIRCELLKCIPVVASEYKQTENLQKFEQIADHSDQCVITSNFLTIPAQ